MKTIILLLASCILFPALASAQSVSAVSATYHYTNTDQALLDTMDAGLLLMEERTITATVTLSSTEGISKIAMLVGSSEGSNDIFYKEFAYGSSGTFNDGTSYAASGNTLTIGLGKFRGRQHYYLSAFAIKTGGDMETAANYVME